MKEKMEVGKIVFFCSISFSFRLLIEIQITFESIIPSPEWSVLVDTTTIKVKEQMLSFRIPKFPWSIDASTLVNVILRQRDRTLGTIEYFYIPKCKYKCDDINDHIKYFLFTSVQSATNISYQFTRSNSNKRSKWTAQMYEEETDAIVPIPPDTPEFQSITSVPVSYKFHRF
jgi:hypothetical protein